MDGAEASRPVSRHPAASSVPRVVGGRGGPSAHTDRRAVQPAARARAERPPVRILVVVASIQGRSLKTEVEKGSV